MCLTKRSSVIPFVEANGPERLPELLPAAAYITLAPFLGAEEAYAIAVG